MKKCRVCGAEKNIDDFPKRKAAKDGHRNDCKVCNREKSNLWAKNNPEKAKARSRKAVAAWRERNPEKVKEDRVERKQYYSEYRKQWATKNRDRIRASAKKSYYSGGVVKTLERNRKRRALLKEVDHAHYTIEEVIDTYGSTCYICGDGIDLGAPRWTAKAGWERGLHIDHKVPIVLGGGDTLQNVRPTHGLCNIKKKDRVV